MHRTRNTAAALATWATLAFAAGAEAQVTVRPISATPGTWERFAVQVTNQIDSPVVTVRIEIPAELVVVGVEPRPEWPFRFDSLESGGYTIEWRGGWIAQGEFQEFRFFGRLRTDLDVDYVLLPVHLTRVGNTSESWVGRGTTPAPRVIVDRAPEFTSRGSAMLGVIALAASFVALAIAVSARFVRPRGGGN